MLRGLPTIGTKVSCLKKVGFHSSCTLHLTFDDSDVGKTNKQNCVFHLKYLTLSCSQGPWCQANRVLNVFSLIPDHLAEGERKFTSGSPFSKHYSHLRVY